MQQVAVRSKYLFKACPRCKGDLCLDQGDRGLSRTPADYVCLQCGRSIDAISLPALMSAGGPASTGSQGTHEEPTTIADAA